MHRLHYFAYGSNLWPPRLQARAASCIPTTRAILPGYQLRFHKLGRDGSAKCDACFTGNDAHQVEGVIYTLLAQERAALDRAEDLGRGYDAHWLDVESEAGVVEVLTYRARSEMVVAGLKPFSWYREYILKGALYHHLSSGYVEQIVRQPAVSDPDRTRVEQNDAILRRDCG